MVVFEVAEWEISRYFSDFFEKRELKDFETIKIAESYEFLIQKLSEASLLQIIFEAFTYYELRTVTQLKTEFQEIGKFLQNCSCTESLQISFSFGEVSW